MKMIELIKPDKVVMLNSSDNFGVFEIKPLEPGYGITLGNSIRRALLSSLEGFAINYININNINHEFATIKGVLEDVTEIVLNFKQIKLKNEVSGFDTETVIADLTKHEQVTGHDIGKFSSYFKVLNNNLVICNKEKNIPLKIVYNINKGRGYVSSEDHIENVNRISNSNTPLLLNTIYIDSIYTPILNVKYNIKNCRVGNKTDFENLLLEITTDGSISPKNALNQAANILIDHFMLFSDKHVDICMKKNPDKNNYDDSVLHMRKILKTKLSDIDGLSRRTLNCLTSASIFTWRDLVSYNQSSILKMRNFGKKSLDELQHQMEIFGLSFGMDISKYDLK